MSEALYISRARYPVASCGLSAHSGGVTHCTRTLLVSTEAVEPALEVDKETVFSTVHTGKILVKRLSRKQSNVLQCDQ